MLNLIYLLNTLHFLNKRLHIILKKLNLMAKKKKIPKIGPAIITTSRLDEIRKRLRETYGLGNLNTNLFKIKPFKSTTESVKDIISGCKSPDVQLRNEALALLYGIIREPIHAFILRYYCGYNYPNDCWDTAGDIALKIATEKNIKNYQQKFGRFRTWILGAVKHKMSNLIKQKKWPPSTIAPFAISLDDPETETAGSKKAHELFQEASEAFEKEEKKSLVIIALDRLKHRDKIYIMYICFHDYSYEEMSKEFDVPLHTVKSNLYRAKQRLKTLLKGLTEELA